MNPLSLHLSLAELWVTRQLLAWTAIPPWSRWRPWLRRLMRAGKLGMGMGMLTMRQVGAKWDEAISGHWVIIAPGWEEVR